MSMITFLNKKLSEKIKNNSLETLKYNNLKRED